jgi:DNA-binding transcriptional regulator YiaG
MAAVDLRTLVEDRCSLPDPDTRRRLRERAKLSQVELARHVGDGVSGSTLCRWETGQIEPRGVLRDRYVEALRCLAEATGTDL